MDWICNKTVDNNFIITHFCCKGWHLQRNFQLVFKISKTSVTRQAYNLFQDLWNRFIILECAKTLQTDKHTGLGARCNYMQMSAKRGPASNNYSTLIHKWSKMNSLRWFASLWQVFVIFAKNIGIWFVVTTNTLGKLVIGSNTNNWRRGEFYKNNKAVRSIRRSLKRTE